MSVPEVKEMKPSEIRWYKGKYKVRLLIKSRGNYGVEALEPIPEFEKYHTQEGYVLMFTTVPRLLWRHPRK